MGFCHISGTKKREVLERGGFWKKLDAFLPPDALSAKCTAGPNILGYLFDSIVSLCVTLDAAETPLLKPRFLALRTVTSLNKESRLLSFHIS